jgi:hypothetical protein
MNEVIKESVLRQKKLNADGITNDRIISIIDQVKTKLNNISPSTDEIALQKQNLLNLCGSQLKLLQ